jgi:hypothetical protein
MDGAIKRFLIRLRRFRKAAQLADELKRRGVDLVVSRGRQEVMQGLYVSAHGNSAG